MIDRVMKDVNIRKKEQKACEDWLKQVSDLGKKGLNRSQIRQRNDLGTVAAHAPIGMLLCPNFRCPMLELTGLKKRIKISIDKMILRLF